MDGTSGAERPQCESKNGALRCLKRGFEGRKHLGPHVSVDGPFVSGQIVHWDEPKPREARTVSAVRMAAQQSQTGEACSNCKGARLVRNGTCNVCLDCGESGGCS